MSKLISKNENGVIYVESDSGEIFGVVSQTEILSADGDKLEDDTLTVLESAGFELEQDWENECTFIEFSEENGETSRLEFKEGKAFLSDYPKTYKIADMVNGPFGEEYKTLEEAEAALAECIAEGTQLNEENAAENAKSFFCIVDAETGEEI